MKKQLIAFLFLSHFAFWQYAASAPVPYSGKVAINGANFQGDARFTFALRDANGTVHWQNGADANTSINVPVDGGLYVVLLGGQGMNALPSNLFLDHPRLYLDVKFYQADTQEWLHMLPNQRITSAPHALAADMANLAQAVEPGAITKSMLAAEVLADLNATIPRSRLAAEVLADLNRTIVITRDMLPASVLSDINATITRSRLAADVLADLNHTIGADSITLDKLSSQVRSDLNRSIVITRDMLPASVLADLNATITRSRLAADVLTDLNGTISRSRLAADVREDLNRTATVVGTGNLDAGLRAYLRPILKGGIYVTTGSEGSPVTLQAPQVDGRFLSYQWYKGGTPLKGATGTQHLIAEFNATRDAGDYEIRVSNAFATLKTKAVLETGSSIIVAAGSYHSFFQKSDGSLHAVGYNYGQLGDGTNNDRTSPVQILASGVTQIATGHSHSLFLKSDGSLHATGQNRYGQLGDGNTTDRNSPVQILASGVTQIAIGYYHSLFLKSDGSLHAMGRNNYGQLGDGNTTDRRSPVQILASGVTQIAAGTEHSLFLKSDGSLHAMGHNVFGQLGDGTTTNRNSPVQILASGVTQIAAGRYHSLFLKSDGSLHAKGDGGYGQLGDGNSGEDVYTYSPVKVIDLISTVEQAYVAETAADVIDPLK
jgi:alpha-tubulin suppressor-like RCC1 family protein